MLRWSVFCWIALRLTAMAASETVDNREKTVYLIRHAESEENRRIACFSRAMKRLGKFSLPSSNDVVMASGLINVPAQVDSDVSKVGEKQIEHVAEKLRKEEFLSTSNVTLVAHSPLKRARQTAQGMLLCDASDLLTVETALLTEKTPAEWLPYNSQSLANRIAAFETWLGKQPHTVVAIVGHSQFFRAMLGLSFKFGNCEVWRLSFDPSANADVVLEKSDHTRHGNAENYKLPRGWSGLKRLYTCEVKETDVDDEQDN